MKNVIICVVILLMTILLTVVVYPVLWASNQSKSADGRE